MAITRRQFIKRTGAATAGALFGPSFFSSRLVQSAMAATIGSRYFITFFLDGGNDGLNTVVPVSNGTTGTLRTAYEAARNTGTGGLRLTAGAIGSSRPCRNCLRPRHNVHQFSWLSTTCTGPTAAPCCSCGT